MSNLVKILKQSNEDFEFYPTSYEMLVPIFEQYTLDKKSVLDIGCGTCNFKTHFETWANWELARREASENRQEALAKANGERYYKTTHALPEIDKYFVIEKSKPLIALLDKETICLGTDFKTANLIDKPVDVIFCNPPYSEYAFWAEKIINEANANIIYLIIPQRWKDNDAINAAIKKAGLKTNVLGSFDFLNAERSARAKVDVIEIKPIFYSSSNRKSEFNTRAFDEFFEQTFVLKETTVTETVDEKKENIKSQLVLGSDSKAKILVDLYNQELETLSRHFQAICSLDLDILNNIGVKKDSVKEALKQRLKGLKILYWEMVFDELDEITSRLTTSTRRDMLSRFSGLKTVEFTLDNIYPLIVWVMKNASEYCNSQLVRLYKQFSDLENVTPYKSNQKTFGNDKWRFRQEGSHYVLDYRIICSSVFSTSYKGNLDTYENPTVINDICVIADNLGFAPEPRNLRQYPADYGTKYYVNMDNGEVLLEYKVHKNGNTHIKLNQEFAKAMNVEVSRLLGWIRTKEDISKEFPEEMAKGAEKYFKANDVISLANNNLNLLKAR